MDRWNRQWPGFFIGRLGRVVDFPQGTRIGRLEELLNQFYKTTDLNSPYPWDNQKFILIREVLHQLETHHQEFTDATELVFGPNVRLEAICSFSQGRYFFINMYSQREEELWMAVDRLLLLDYNPANFESVGLQSGNNSDMLKQWGMNTGAMRRWLARSCDHENEIHLTGFIFDHHSTDVIFEAAVNGTKFNFLRCRFQPSHQIYQRSYLSMIVTKVAFDPTLLFMILKMNADVFFPP